MFLSYSGVRRGVKVDCVELGTLYDDVSAEVSARAFVSGVGVNINDFDGDGELDIYRAVAPVASEPGVTTSGADLLYLNDGDFHFVEIGADAGLADVCEDHSPLFGDLDNDGLPDLYLTVDGQNLLYRNLGGGRFADVTAQAGAAGHPGAGHQGMLLDYDRDGYLDVFFTNGGGNGSGFNTLLRNQRDGTLRDVTWEAGVAGDPSGTGDCVLDADNDGWLDIFVATGIEFGSHLFVNQGDGTFHDEALERGISDPLARGELAVSCGDLDNDSDDDILIGTDDALWGGNQLFENEGGTFTDIAAAAGVASFIGGYGQTLVDVDLDGLQDLILSSTEAPPTLLMNNGDMTFSPVCGGGGLSPQEAVSWGVVAGDMTHDGYSEVVFSTKQAGGGPAEAGLFRHRGGENHWLTVDARGATRNPSAIGARVTLTVGGESQTRRVGGWSALDSQGPLPVTFGTGQAVQIERVNVMFPDGVEVETTAVAADQVIVIQAPDARADDDRDGVPDEWDLCPRTPVGVRTDGEGCGIGQRGGVAVGLTAPADGEILTSVPTFSWDGNSVVAVLQISFDGTFGPTGRLAVGPLRDVQEFTPDDDQWRVLVANSDGTSPILWRVVAMSEDGAEAMTDARTAYVALAKNEVHIPLGANLFQPAHIVVRVGDAVTWWNDSVAAGNLNAETHEVQLFDPFGRPQSGLTTLDSAGTFTSSFDEAGTWTVLCPRHSGGSVSSGTDMRLASPPYRCMAGTITAR